MGGSNYVVRYGMKFGKWLVGWIAGGCAVFLALNSASGAQALLPCIADTALSQQSPDNNFGGASSLPIGRTSTGARSRGLYKFAVTNIPAGATIHSATLELEVVLNNLEEDRSFSVHRVRTGWGEGNKAGEDAATAGEATWNARFFPDLLWSLPGGASDVDFVGTPSASEELSGIGRYIFTSDTLVSDVQRWLNNPGTNFGWLVKIDSESVNGTELMFASREDTEGAGPTLRVQYDLPGQSRPRLMNSRREGLAFVFDFNADPSRPYFIEYSTNLRNWTLLDLVPPGPARTVTISDPMGTEPRFYRITAL